MNQTNQDKRIQNNISTLNENELIILPRRVEHKPIADEEVWVMLFEPKGTINAGDTKSVLTKENLDSI